MPPKLTLRLDERLIQRAKAHSRRTGKSVSQMVADYFALLDDRVPTEERALPPRVRRLKGLLRGGREITPEDYRRHLEKKHR